MRLQLPQVGRQEYIWHKGGAWRGGVYGRIAMRSDGVVGLMNVLMKSSVIEENMVMLVVVFKKLD